MNQQFREISDGLKQAGWSVEMRRERAKRPQIFEERFSWLPDVIVDFACSFDRVIAPKEQAWLITWPQLSGESDSSFAWNQWELDSLSAAEGDEEWKAEIRGFWDDHLPLLLSVKSGYAFVAIRKDFAIVVGEEPEFEETVELAGGLLDFLQMLCERNRRLDQLI